MTSSCPHGPRRVRAQPPRARGHRRHPDGGRRRRAPGSRACSPSPISSAGYRCRFSAPSPRARGARRRHHEAGSVQLAMARHRAPRGRESWRWRRRTASPRTPPSSSRWTHRALARGGHARGRRGRSPADPQRMGRQRRPPLQDRLRRCRQRVEGRGSACTVVHVQRYVGTPTGGQRARDGSLPRGTAPRSCTSRQQGLVAALGLPAHKRPRHRPPTGGGFGTKATGYPEDPPDPRRLIVCRRPVKGDRQRRGADHGCCACAPSGARHRDRCAAGRHHARRCATRPAYGAYNSWIRVCPTTRWRISSVPIACPRRRVPGGGDQQDPERASRARAAGAYAMDRIVDCGGELRPRSSGGATISAADLPAGHSVPSTATRSSTTAATFAPTWTRRWPRSRRPARRSAASCAASASPATWQAPPSRDPMEAPRCARTPPVGPWSPPERASQGAGTRDLVRPGGRARPRHPVEPGHRGGWRHRRHPYCSVASAAR